MLQMEIVPFLGSPLDVVEKDRTGSILELLAHDVDAQIYRDLAGIHVAISLGQEVLKGIHFQTESGPHSKHRFRDIFEISIDVDVLFVLGDAAN